MEKVKLVDVADIIAGQSPPSDTYNKDKVGLPFFQGKTDFGYQNPTPRTWCSIPLKIAEPLDILVSVRAPVGSVNINTEKACIGRGIMSVRAKKRAERRHASREKLIHQKYLYYYFIKHEEQIEALGTGSTFKAIKKSELENLEIPLPPLPTQQKIAEILDTADQLRQYNKQLIEKYDALTQSLFLDMFGDPVRNEKGWEMKYLGDLCDVGSSRRVFVDDLVEQGVPFYRGTEVGQMSLNDTIIPTLFITEQHYEKLKIETGVPKIGDLLMPSICPDGRIFEVTNNNPFYFKDGRVLWIKVNDKLINSVYLKKQLKAIFAVDYAKIASGTTFAELKIFALKKINIPYPPITLQTQFAERVQMIAAQKQQAQDALAKSEALFQSLLQRAFNGTLCL